MVHASSTTKSGERYVYISGATETEIGSSLKAALRENPGLSREDLWNEYRNGHLASALIVSSQKADNDKNNTAVTTPKAYLVLKLLHSKTTIVINTDQNLTENARRRIRVGRKGDETEPDKPKVKLETAVFDFDGRSTQDRGKYRSLPRLNTNEEKLESTFRYLDKFLLHLDDLIRKSICQNDITDNSPKDTPLLKPDLVVFEQPVITHLKAEEKAILDKPVGFHLNFDNNRDGIDSLATADDRNINSQHIAQGKPDSQGWLQASAIEFDGKAVNPRDFSDLVKKFIKEHAPNLGGLKIFQFGNDADFKSKRQSLLGWWATSRLGNLCSQNEKVIALRNLQRQLPKPEKNVPKSLSYALFLAEAEKAKKIEQNFNTAVSKDFSLNDNDEIFAALKLEGLSSEDINSGSLQFTRHDPRLSQKMDKDFFAVLKQIKSMTQLGDTEEASNGHSIRRFGQDLSSGLYFSEVDPQGEANNKIICVSSKDISEKGGFVSAGDDGSYLKIIYKDGVADETQRIKQFKTTDGHSGRFIIKYKHATQSRDASINYEISCKLKVASK